LNTIRGRWFCPLGVECGRSQKEDDDVERKEPLASQLVQLIRVVDLETFLMKFAQVREIEIFGACRRGEQNRRRLGRRWTRARWARGRDAGRRTRGRARFSATLCAPQGRSQQAATEPADVDGEQARNWYHPESRSVSRGLRE
jgi:hypothetical protein